MKNIYENLLKLDRNNDYQIFNNIELSFSFLENEYHIIEFNIKYNKEYLYNEDYEIRIKDENIIINLLNYEDDNRLYKIELFRLNYIQFDLDSEDNYISFIIYSFLLNRFNYIRDEYIKMMKD